jgi:phage-related protein
MKVVLNNTVTRFIESLSEKEIAKCIHTLELLETFGNELGMPHSRHMSGGLLELRVSGKRAIRILYCFENQNAILLHAFIKKTQQTPKREIEIAREIMKKV